MTNNKPTTYCAVVTAESSNTEHSAINDDLHSTVLPSSHDLEWVPESEFTYGPNPALAVIKYVLESNSIDSSSDAMDFLNYWNEGEFDILRNNWNDIPDDVFIGADPLFKPE